MANTKTTWKRVKEGDVVVNPVTLTERTVERISPARARGYLVIEFTNGTRTSLNDTTEALVKQK